MIGQSINHYRITAKLGEGGMGAVYQATDTRLGREVALKILPEKFSRDRQRMGQFQREAEVLASLNHPHISMIHGLEEANGVRALVLELVEGPTLAERIAEGPIAVEKALRMALEIAQALEAAHDQGIVHRDLKPANVKITSEGTVKVLDFGLAKALETGVSPRELANSPTLRLEATREGIVLGTAAYMSPEQARGKIVDKRTDIWSFGLVLFEMLTGRAMFTGKSFTETLAAVIHQEPSLAELSEAIPREIRELLGRCLRRDPRMRLRDMGDARITIDECLAGGVTRLEALPVARPSLPIWKDLAPWAAVPFLMVLAWMIRGWSAPIPEKTISRWEIPAGEAQIIAHQNRTGIAFSPDASLLAFVAGPDLNRQPGIYLRSLDRWDTVRLSDDIAWMPFFSPDGKWVGAVSRPDDGSDLKLKKCPIEGGTPTTICDCSSSPASSRFSSEAHPFGASWASDDTIVFACEGGGPLWRVSALGGEPQQLTELDRETGERSHRLPHVIPGANAVLFTILRRNYGTLESRLGEIAVHSLETGERKVLIKGGLDARYVPSGHLVFAREATLWAAPFDRAGLEVTGPEFPVLEGVSHALYTGGGTSDTGSAQFAVSSSGSLVYIAGSVAPESKREIVWVYRNGEVESIGIEPAKYHTVRLSPDGLKVALDTNYKYDQIWTYDLGRRARSIQSFDGDENLTPIWSPDGATLVFNSNRLGIRSLFSTAVDGAGEPERLFPSRQDQAVGSWFPDGTKLAFNQAKPNSNNYDIWILSMDGSHSAKPFLETRFQEMSPEFSPNGQWLAYVSNESGRNEVYVERYPQKGAKKKISSGGGVSPAWSGSGDELFYFTSSGYFRPRKYWSVDITINGNSLKAGKPVILFEKECVSSLPTRSYDVTPDGQRFLIVSRNAAQDQTMWREYFGEKMSVVLNWSEELRRLAPSD